MFAKIKQYQTHILAFVAQLRDLRVVGMLVFLVILLLVSWSGVKTIETNYALQKQISRLQQENAVKKLTNENMKLENQYFNTPQYLELAARRDFGLAAPGEPVIAVPRAVALSYTVDLPKPAVAEKTKAQSEPSVHQRNFQAWVDFLFHRNNKE